MATAPTVTERRLQQSLPSNIRNKPAEEVIAGQTLAGGSSNPTIARGGGRSRGPTQTRMTVEDIREVQRKAEIERRSNLIKDTNQQSANLRNQLRLELQNKLSNRSLTLQQRQDLQREFGNQSRDIKTQRENIQSEIRSGGSGGNIVVDSKSVDIRSSSVDPNITSFRSQSISEVQEFKQTRFERVKDIPSRIVERVTGKKPREVFRFITGARETDVTKPLTLKEVSNEIAEIPLSKVGFIGGGLISKATTSRLPEGGFTVKFKARTDKVIEPVFGTETTSTRTIEGNLFEGNNFKVVENSSPGLLDTIRGNANFDSGGVMTKTLEVPERTAQIFERKRTQQGIIAGTQLGILAVAPMSIVAPALIVTGTTTALDTTKAPLERTLGVFEASLGATVLGRGFQKWGTSRIIKDIPLRAVDESLVGIEREVIINIGGKDVTGKLGSVVGEKSPPRVITETTRFRQGLDFADRNLDKVFRIGNQPTDSRRFAPVIKKFIPAENFFITTPNVVTKADKPFEVVTTFSKSKLEKTSLITPIGKPRDLVPEDIKGLSKIQQMLFQRSASKEVPSGIIALEDIPKVLSKDTRRIITETKNTNLFELRPFKGGVNLKLLPDGSRTTTSLSFTTLGDKVSTKFGDIIKAKTLTKDVSKPGARATGRTQELNTFIIGLKDKAKDKASSLLDDVSDITEKIKPVSKVKTTTEAPITTQFEIPQRTSISPTTKIIEKVKSQTEKIVERGSQISTGVFGSESVFAGTGQFERSSFTGLNNLKRVPDSITTSLGGLEVDTKVKTDLSFTPAALRDLENKPALVRELDLKNNPELARELEIGLVSEQSFSGIQSGRIAQPTPSTVTIQLPQTTTQPAQAITQSPSLGFGAPPRTTTITPRIIPLIPIIPKQEDIKRRKGRVETSAKTKPGYYPEVKEKGKWIRVARKPRTRKEALAIAGRIVDNSTAVQLRLIDAKKKAIKETIKRGIKRNKYRDYSIRGNKKTPLTNQGLIELKKNRIDTRGEKNQLSASKLLKGKGTKTLNRGKKKSVRRSNFLLGGGFGGKSQSFF